MIASFAEHSTDALGSVLQPCAFVSASALQSNYAILRARGEIGRLDLSADAWGHGVDFVRAQLSEAARSNERDVIDNTRLLGLADGYKPVMTLVGTVLSIKHLDAGDGVSYGYTYRAEHDTTVALVTGGYAQGIVRGLGNHATVRFGEEALPIVGRVAMDVCVVEIRDADVEPGSRVVFFGPDHPVGLWADATGMQSSELVTGCGLHAVRRAVS